MPNIGLDGLEFNSLGIEKLKAKAEMQKQLTIVNAYIIVIVMGQCEEQLVHVL